MCISDIPHLTPHTHTPHPTPHHHPTRTTHTTHTTQCMYPCDHSKLSGKFPVTFPLQTRLHYQSTRPGVTTITYDPFQTSHKHIPPHNTPYTPTPHHIHTTHTHHIHTQAIYFSSILWWDPCTKKKTIRNTDRDLLSTHSAHARAYIPCRTNWLIVSGCGVCEDT